MRKEIREQLQAQAEEEYRDFSSALIPGSRPLLGVRLPVLRKMAKEIVKGDWRKEAASQDGEQEDFWFEEIMLRGMIIGYGTEKADTDEGLYWLKKMIPLIDSWSVCDSFCTGFGFAARHRAEVWEFLKPYLISTREFEVRTALILLLDQFLKIDKNGKKCPRKRVITMKDLVTDTSEKTRGWFPYTEPILKVLNRRYDQGYYAQMAAAWTTAEAFVTFPYETLQMLERDCRMDPWTKKKACQKICESRIPDEEVKAYILKLSGKRRYTHE